MPAARSKPTRVAIACQGGGSHTAFTAGVLERVLPDQRYEMVALSGTSGGAIDALLAWYGLLADGREGAGRRLAAFWEDMSARSWPERALNDWSVAAYRALGGAVGPEVSPYAYPALGAARLREVLEAHVDFDAVPGLAASAGASLPALLVGAVEVLSGRFEIFRNAWDAGAGRARLEVGPEAILASAAVPTLFRAVAVGDGVYWDGLFSQNPPVRELPDTGPDEIWVIQINPTSRDAEPRTVADIRDRRNELAGNLSLSQELFFIEKINELVTKGLLDPARYRHIPVRRIEMAFGRHLDHESKLDRNPAFVARLLERGREQGEAFLAA